MYIETSTALPSTRSLYPLSVFLVSPPSESDAKDKKEYFLWACVAIFLACLLASARLPLPQLASASTSTAFIQRAPALLHCALACSPLAGPQRRSRLPVAASAHLRARLTIARQLHAPRYQPLAICRFPSIVLLAAAFALGIGHWDLPPTMAYRPSWQRESWCGSV